MFGSAGNVHQDSNATNSLGQLLRQRTHQRSASHSSSSANSRQSADANVNLRSGALIALPSKSSQLRYSDSVPASSSQLSSSLGSVAQLNSVQGPFYDSYGFVLYLLSIVLFIVYILWSFVPDRLLNQIGITYYFSKYWALALPCYFMLCLCYVLFLAFCHISVQTPSLDSPYHITDEYATLMKRFSDTRTSTFKSRSFSKDLTSTSTQNFNEDLYPNESLHGVESENNNDDGIPELMDLPLTIVSSCLYGLDD